MECVTNGDGADKTGFVVAPLGSESVVALKIGAGQRAVGPQNQSRADEGAAQYLVESRQVIWRDARGCPNFEHRWLHSDQQHRELGAQHPANALGEDPKDGGGIFEPLAHSGCHFGPRVQPVRKRSGPCGMVQGSGDGVWSHMRDCISEGV